MQWTWMDFIRTARRNTKGKIQQNSWHNFINRLDSVLVLNFSQWYDFSTLQSTVHNPFCPNLLTPLSYLCLDTE